MAPTELDWLCRCIGLLLEHDEVNAVVCDVGGLSEPDAGCVDALARLQLSIRRSGGQLQIHNVCARLHELLELAGLLEVLPIKAELGIQTSGQSEQGKERVGVEEEGDPRDLPAEQLEDL